MPVLKIEIIDVQIAAKSQMTFCLSNVGHFPELHTTEALCALKSNHRAKLQLHTPSKVHVNSSTWIFPVS